MVFASGNLYPDKAPSNLSDQQSLQRGAKTFVTYCLACHSAQAMHYDRMRDIGFTEKQIKHPLIIRLTPPCNTS
jgi:ubiquinol-cytochrome c reductase cytochrome c1 subunit